MGMCYTQQKREPINFTAKNGEGLGRTFHIHEKSREDKNNFNVILMASDSYSLSKSRTIQLYKGMNMKEHYELNSK